MIRRDWSDAIEAHEDWPCRICGRWPRELAHILKRELDERRGAIVYVHPRSICPLCPSHHGLYDAHRLNLLPHLFAEEIELAVRRVGEGSAMRRIMGPDYPRSTVE